MAQYEDFFHLVVALLLIARDRLVSVSDHTISKDVLFHRLRAISMLRRRLACPNAATDDDIVLVIAFLCVSIPAAPFKSALYRVQMS